MPSSSAERRPRRPNPATRALAWAVVRLRYLILAAWIAGTAVAVTSLPGLASAPSPGLTALLPASSAPLRAARSSAKLFGFPVQSGFVVVRRNPHGLGPDAERRAIEQARAASQDDNRLAAAVPVTDALLRRGGRATTVLYYLFPSHGVTPSQGLALARHFAATLPPRPGAFTGVTGLAAAELEHSSIIRSTLGEVELATILWVLFAVGVHFRALIAPLVDLFAVGIAYLLSIHVVGWVSGLFGHAIPQEVQPVVVVLIFGIVTDYTIFLLSRQRTRLREGLGTHEAVRLTTRDVAGIVFAAGITVCAASAALTAARTTFFALFGPALAVSVLIAVVVAVTFVPAALALLGRWAFWPRRPRGGEQDGPPGAEAAVTGSGAVPLRGRIVRLAGRHPALTSLVVVAALLGGATGLRHYALAAPEIRALPANAAAQRAYAAAARGFGADGIVAPTVVLVRGRGVAHRPRALDRLEGLLRRQPGVALVLGSAEQPLRGRPLGLARSEGGDAARYLVVLRAAPMGARATATLGRLEGAAPGLARRAGLGHVRISFGGQTAVARAIVQRTTGDLERVGPIALVAIFIVVAVFLRALVAPLYLVLASALSVATALGLTAYLHVGLVGLRGIGFFVPFATAILLLALGSDYTVFLIGRIWQEAPQRPLREAVIAAGTRASRPITVAGVILSGSFAMLAVIPISSYRLAAFTMGVGLLIDALIVRTLLVPALVSWVGRRRSGAPPPAPAEQ